MTPSSLIRPLILALMSFLACGCGAFATSRPIYDAQTEPILDRRLAGTWCSQQGGVLEFKRWRCVYWMRGQMSNCDKSYTPEPMPVDLVRFGNKSFLFMAILPFSEAPGIGTPLFPCWRIEFADRGKTLRLRMLDTLALAEYFQDHPGEMKYEEEREGPFYHSLTVSRPATEPNATQPTTQRQIKNMILTDDPKRIRRFLTEHADDSRFWSPAGIYGRVGGS
jgi:hypothetical protein